MAAEDDDLPPQLLYGLFEALSYDELLEDAGVAAALEAALTHVNDTHDLQLSNGGRYTGLYRLLAHSSKEFRELVSACS